MKQNLNRTQKCKVIAFKKNKKEREDGMGGLVTA
jgi:hypothetical protein